MKLKLYIEGLSIVSPWLELDFQLTDNLSIPERIKIFWTLGWHRAIGYIVHFLNPRSYIGDRFRDQAGSNFSSNNMRARYSQLQAQVSPTAQLTVHSAYSKAGAYPCRPSSYVTMRPSYCSGAGSEELTSMCDAEDLIPIPTLVLWQLREKFFINYCASKADECKQLFSNEDREILKRTTYDIVGFADQLKLTVTRTGLNKEVSDVLLSASWSDGRILMHCVANKKVHLLLYISVESSKWISLLPTRVVCNNFVTWVHWRICYLSSWAYLLNNKEHSYLTFYHKLQTGRSTRREWNFEQTRYT